MHRFISESSASSSKTQFYGAHEAEGEAGKSFFIMFGDSLLHATMGLTSYDVDWIAA